MMEACQQTIPRKVAQKRSRCMRSASIRKDQKMWSQVREWKRWSRRHALVGDYGAFAAAERNKHGTARVTEVCLMER